MKFIILAIVSISLVQFTLAAVKLGSYNVDKSKITVSGISAGGAMAVQLHAAFSASISGIGIVTGPPYYCAQGSVNTATSTCMSGSVLSAYSPTSAQTKLASYVTAGTADSTTNLKNAKVYNYHGTQDFTVVTSVSTKNEDFYKAYSVQMKTVYTYASAHGFITNNYGSACGTTNSQYYINNCNYNQAYDILNYLYGLDKPEPAKDTKAKEALIEFDQKEFFTATNANLDTIAYVYVPKNCQDGKTCKLHIALHGCLQGRYKIGNVFAENIGFNQVGDDNDVIILYPQAISTVLTNPNGCFDWWGYTDANYANKKGIQMVAIKAMIDRLTAGTTVVTTQAPTTTAPPNTGTSTLPPNPTTDGNNATVSCTCRMKNDPNSPTFYLEF